MKVVNSRVRPVTVRAMAGVDEDRERSPLHEQRDSVFDVDSNNREMFRTRVRKSGSSGLVPAKGPLVRVVYFPSDNIASSNSHLIKEPFLCPI